LPPSKPLVINAWSTPRDPADLKERLAEHAQAGFTHALSAFRNPKHGRLIRPRRSAGLPARPA